MVRLASLFDRRDHRWVGPYRSIGAELAAVAAGTKAMSLFPVLRAGDAEHRALETAAARLQLDAVLDLHDVPGLPRELRTATLLVVRGDEAWRIPAYRALWTAAVEGGGWSDALELQQSALLGYTARERAAYRAELQRARIAWGCDTVYTLLDRGQLAALRALGGRTLAVDIGGRTLFKHREGRAIARTARLPRDLTLARLGLAWATSRAWFTDPRPLQTVTLTSAQSTALHTALRASIELWRGGRWRPVGA